MPVEIPGIEEMFLRAMKETGKTREVIQGELDAYVDQNRGLARTPKLAMYLYLKNILGIETKVVTTTCYTLGSISDIRTSEYMTFVQLKGYLVNIWKYTTSTKKEALGFILMDKSDSVTGLIFFADAMKCWKNAKLEIGNYVRLTNVNLNEWEGVRTIRPLGATKYEVISPPYELEDLVVSVGELQDGKLSVINVVVFSCESREYIGCPNCKAKLDVEEGVETQCTSKQQCGTVVAKVNVILDLLASDGSNDVSLIMFGDTSGMLSEEALGGTKLICVLGVYSKDKDQFTVNTMLGSKQAPAIQETRVLTPKGIQDNVLTILRNWKVRPLDKLVEDLVGILDIPEAEAKASINTLVGSGAIVIKDNICQITTE